uniref:Cytochrome c oxidase subunit 2 n=1 Tax=Nuttalliella namaqua TaxID=1029659 RepID=A0A1P8AG98_9ACAR|nr:cytochrome c oxidase subunit II [Nuttalliella namaqua]UYB78173.1 cytochrome c oxidase subunit II [Nuttalliella namaqua]
MSTWKNMNFQESNSPIMEQMIFFHDHTMMIIILIALITLYMITNLIFNKFYSRLKMDNHEIEIMWTILPAMILIFIALPSLRILYMTEDNIMSTLLIKIKGHQWYWSYEYANFNKEFDSFMIPQEMLKNNMFRLLDVDNRLILPMKISTRLMLTSYDVIHSWTIPSMGVKMDAIPNRLNQTILFPQRPGIYYGQCSEICGVNHSFMPITLEIISLNDFMKWLKT